MKNEMKGKMTYIIKTTKRSCFTAGRIQAIALNINLRFDSTEFRENSDDKIYLKQ